MINNKLSQITNKASQVGCVIWVTGLSASGKTTLSHLLRDLLLSQSYPSIILDGDCLRDSLSSILTLHEDVYSQASRLQIATAYSKLAQYLSSQGIIVIVSTISMFHDIHALNRQIIPHYFEVYLRASPRSRLRRDPKNLYNQSLRQNKMNMVGFNTEFEPPLQPHLIIENSDDTDPSHSAKLLFSKVLSWIHGLSTSSR